MFVFPNNLPGIDVLYSTLGAIISTSETEDAELLVLEHLETTEVRWQTPAQKNKSKIETQKESSCYSLSLRYLIHDKIEFSFSLCHAHLTRPT